MKIAVSIFLVIAFGTGLWKTIEHRPAAGFQVNIHPAPTDQQPRFETDFVSSKLYTQTHAASLVD